MSNLSMTKVYPRVSLEVNPEDIYRPVNILDHSDMDVKETRRKRLRELIDSRYGGKQAAFAADIERQPDYVSRCLKGTKNIGEDLARIIEKRLRLPLGWLDRDHAEAGGAESAPEPEARTIAELIRRMSPAIATAPKDIQDAIDGLVLRYQENPKEGERIARAVKTLLEDDP